MPNDSPISNEPGNYNGAKPGVVERIVADLSPTTAEVTQVMSRADAQKIIAKRLAPFMEAVRELVKVDEVANHYIDKLKLRGEHRAAVERVKEEMPCS
jgi:hypothetical protein